MNTTYFKNIVAGNVLGYKKSPALPATVYMGLSSSAPKEDGSGVTEPSTSATGYARVALTSSILGDPVDGVVTNKADITFPESLTDWFPSATPATHYVLFDGTGANANLLIYGTLAKSRIIQSETQARWPANSLTIEVI